MRIEDLVQKFGGQFEGSPGIEVAGVIGMDQARADWATFAMDDRLLTEAEASNACCVIVPLDARASTKPLIRCKSPDGYVADLLTFFHPEPPACPGVHPTAVIDETAQIDESATIGAQVVIGKDVRVAKQVHLHAGVRVGDACTIGAETVIHPNVVLYRQTEIGSRVLIHAGASLGADGFGFFVDDGKLRKWPHVGNVVVHDDVEIGANACIDRGKYGSTVIERSVKIDNLVQIGHNCQIGQGSILAGMVGLSGSVVLEEGVVCGGNAGAIDHIKIGRGAQLGAKAVAIRDVPPGAAMFGNPAKPRRESLGELVMLEVLTKNRKTIKRLIRQANAQANANKE